jgi:recombinational DNA repair protein (RecF pathway)
MLRFAAPDPHPESFDLFQDALRALGEAPPDSVTPLGLRLLWRQVGVLGFSPSLEACVIDGTMLPAGGVLPFNPREGGALCPACAAHHGAIQLPERARGDLTRLLDDRAELPVLDTQHAAAHRRLLARYIRYHLAEGGDLPALEFWMRQPWEAA